MVPFFSGKPEFQECFLWPVNHHQAHLKNRGDKMKNTLKILLSLAFALSLASAVEAKRGSDGQLNLLYWQAPSTMNPNLSGGTKELEASSVVLEPLGRYDENGNLLAWLAEEIPTVANGGISKDLTTITWKIK
ncbi:uncharacterized protein METZ01_LOCUS12622, partial [marine metagenome]